MNVTPLWQKFKQLGALDAHILSLKNRLLELSETITKLERSIAQQETTLEGYLNNKKRLDVEIALLEGEIKAELASIAAKEKQLDVVLNEKQRMAIEHELAAKKSLCSSLEDLCLEKLENLALLNRSIESTMPNGSSLLEEDKGNLQKLQAEILTVKAALISYTQEESDLMSSITDEWLKKYQDMKATLPDPIAAITQNSCGSCFYEVLPRDLIRLKNNAILPCQNCFRLLYFDPEA